MGPMLRAAIREAGLSEVAELVLAGQALAGSRLEPLRHADVMLVAAMADHVRKRVAGAQVSLVDGSFALHGLDVRVVPPLCDADGLTGEAALREVALLRLGTAPDVELGLSWDDWGLALAQAALLFGVSALCGQLGSRRVLPLLDSTPKRRSELTGLITRSGRVARWYQAAHAADLEQGPTP